MKLSLDITLPASLAGEQQRLAEAVTDAVSRATDGVKRDLRAAVLNAGLGQGLANAWRSKLYPAGRASLNATGYVYSAAPMLHRVFSQGVTIRGRHGG